MTLMLACMSHTPGMGLVDAGPDGAEAMAALARLRSRIEAFGADLVVLFGSDHFNGFFYDVLPPFCVGMAAETIGDYGTQRAELQVPTAIAEEIALAAQSADIDVAVSYRMNLDHAFSQPLQHLLGDVRAKPVIPIFLNAAAPPRPSMSKAAALGSVTGRLLSRAHAERRVLVIGSGGLSHDPPTPTLEAAPPSVRERMISGRFGTVEDRQSRERMVIDAARAFASGDPSQTQLKPFDRDWDETVITLLSDGRLPELSAWTDRSIGERGGRGGQEIRTWLAAFSLAAAYGPYRAETLFHRQLPAWLVSFAVCAAEGPQIQDHNKKREDDVDERQST